MDEPTAALGVEETNRVHELMKQLKNEGVAIILISHDLHDIFKLSDRVAVLKNGVLIGTRKTSETTKDEVLTMIILGQPEIQSKMDDQIYQ
jgi:D-xylose transport system ATP-binding protein